MHKATPPWKVVLAVFSLLLTVFVWERGLEESFSRPSVTPALSLHQHEIALLAEPAVPKPFRAVLVGEKPRRDYRDLLSEIPSSQLEERERLIAGLLEPSEMNRRNLLEAPFQKESYASLKKIVLENFGDSGFPPNVFQELVKIKSDPLLYRLSCLGLGGKEDVCIDSNISRTMAIRLSVSQFLPAIAVLLGSGLLIRQIWLLFRNAGISWPPLVALPLPLIDMLLLVAGGFVVLGEVVFPTLVAPISQSLTKGIDSPIREALRVFIGYSVMTVPPLIILRQQMNGLKSIQPPEGGWLQWRIAPVAPAFYRALTGWLMVTPLVLLTSWLINVWVGDQGGSNPLLEIVLSSKDPLALLFLLGTTVLLAPLFEELIFRGALLPVLAKEFGVRWGVLISALIFAVAHLSVGEFAPLTVLGLGLAIVRLSTGRLLPCIFMHSLWNGITFLSLLLLGG